ncbi:MAG TPA: CoA-binding protein [Opitutaceae bacterium]|nr:CoA-binding protein [Opitutaceae bacterium]
MIPADDGLRRILREARTIAVVGLSGDSAKPSHEVAAYLQAQGYRIIPVNPRGGVILGETVYADLRAVPEPVDLVDVFRPAAACLEVARAAVAVGAKTLWLQLGIVNDEAAALAHAAGLAVVMDRCTLREHRRLLSRQT